MAAVDVFVILTRCQFSREHFQNRFRYQDKWYSMGVVDAKHKSLILHKHYANPGADWQKIKRRLPQFADWLSQFDSHIQSQLWMTNIAIIRLIAEQLGIKTEIILDPIPSCTGTDRLVEICKALNADTYLAGRSGASYMEPDKFEKAGIKVECQVIKDTRHVFEP
jgi:hypothetical protein